MIGFYATQLRLLSKWTGGPGGVIRRGVATFVIAALALVVTAWLIPGLSLRDIPSGIIAALTLAAMRTLLRPVLIAYVSQISIAVATIVMVLVQALVFWLISQVGWIAIERPVDAVIGSVLFSIGNALVTAVLSTGDDYSFFGTLVRQLEARRRETETSDEPGVVLIQIDGLAYSILEDNLRAGRTPKLGRWLRSGAMTLDRWRPLLPTQTSASQAGILHGNNDGIPGFRWWDKKTQRLMVSNHPKDAREIMRRISNGDGLLANGGASIGNLLSGDAPRSFLTAATLDDPAREIRRRHVLDWFFISPYSYIRWTLLSIGEIFKELVQARAARTELRGPRGFPYPLARAATNVLLRHLSTALVIEEMWRRSSPIYVDFVDYDEIAHHAGPDRVEARDSVAGLDKIIGIIEKATTDAPRPYRFIVLSDHGQSPGAMFAQRYRKSLEALVQELAGKQVKVQGATAHVEHWGRISPLLSEASGINGMTRTMTSAPFRHHAGARDDAEKPSVVVVAASGNLGLISFPAVPGRAPRETIDARYPGLIDGLVRHPGIGLVMVRPRGRGPVVLGAGGACDLTNGHVDGIDPLERFEATAAEGLRRVDSMVDCGDLVIVSLFEPESGEVAPFEEQIGSHG
ncbi:MAG TPA: alkaline phosphatase family protein, partial [Candidatus Limnocylindria bacterium]|nr:alkaline phosphatase family protein [Candidatus Limnocylindria bacterium]